MSVVEVIFLYDMGFGGDNGSFQQQESLWSELMQVTTKEKPPFHSGLLFHQSSADSFGDYREDEGVAGQVCKVVPIHSRIYPAAITRWAG